MQQPIPVTRGLDQSQRAVRRSPIADSGKSGGAADNRLAARVGDVPIAWADLGPRLIEAAGVAPFEELVLDVMLEQRAATAGVVATPEALERERAILIASYLDSGLATDRVQAERLIAEVRATRGLGPRRFDDMLHRNALLRGLVAHQVRIDETAIERAHEFKHGPRYRVRLITTSSAAQAARAAERCRAGEAFSRVAAELSTDTSAVRGGVVDPISPVDLTYPETLRQAIVRLRPGELSPVIALESGYAIVVLDAIEAPDGRPWEIARHQRPSLDSVRPELVAMETRRQERLLMDQLVRELLASAAVRVEDPDLARLWQQRNGLR